VNPQDLLFSPTHEWVRIEQVEGQKIATIGISAFAIQELSDLVYMELPEVGQEVQSQEEFGEVESVKAVSSLYSPVDGVIVDVNSQLPDRLETLSDDPYGAGWIIKVRLTNEDSLGELLSYGDYQKQCAAEG
jgi:glycine cleavage system H protein